ncbi:amidase [Cupriavidus necator N-1]|uniref:Amidase n=1 Tax=Cupriavidus necator (strain ATCC 43291 / DSM 13513 / CCUG 52238 / LMG 8453 / N-1) TaxID=1042878 RepID=G0EVK7_CUPNN|nr:amidase family protein [Cupriavidus necator]AEI77022.1 amidase [Cupriavidus necator N-1]MDX6014415.1 amidase family protein [Cupriavidus necator]
MTTQDRLTSASAVELRRLIGSREISPVELLEACIARIETYNPLINAITATCFERARKEARAAEQAMLRGEPLGLLHGLPLGVKDLEATEGLLTTYGSPLFRNHVPTDDNVLVKRLRAAGAIVVGKTNIPEMGAGANSRNAVWGATGNPFNPNLNAGGSSGGSAAALAADFLPVCTGSDTGGSLRIPAAKCGVVGFRPSPGIVPNSRKLLGWTPISVVGPMGRTVADTCLQLAASAGVSVTDPLSYAVDAAAYLSPAPVDLSSLRVGWTEDFGSCAVDDGVRRVFRARIAEMRHLFRQCDEVRFELGDVHRCFDVLRAESFVAGLHDAYQRDPASLGPNTRANYELGAKMSLGDSAWAQAEQNRILQRFQGAYQEYDLILSPTTPVSPFAWTRLFADTINGEKQENYYRWLALTYVVTLTTHPAISLPCGTDEAGMPFGLQVTGRFRGDLETLGAAQAMEAAFAMLPALRRPVPDLAALRPANPSLRSIVTAPPASGTVQQSGGVSAV